MEKELLRLERVNKSYDGRQILEDLNLTIHENEFVTLLGPSGCGKTTILRLIGGFETPDSGKIWFDGQDITNLQPEKRQVNTVFQKYSLFSHMDVAENIAFGLKLKGKSASYIRDKIKYALKLVNLDGYEHARVTQMSGGQQQRIAIARAIVNEPKVLLLDEPLSALDLKLRQNMQRELVKIKRELGITFVFVTHDQEEALSMSDTVVVMNQGWIQQIGTPENVYNEPENAFVADFIGDSNILDGIIYISRKDGSYGEYTFRRTGNHSLILDTDPGIVWDDEFGVSLEYPLFAIGELQLCWVTAVKPEGNNRCSLSLINYSEEIFRDDIKEKKQ